MDKASEQGYSAFLSLGSKSINYATNVVLSTALKVSTRIGLYLLSVSKTVGTLCADHAKEQ